MTHPPTRRDDTTDTIHGTPVADPYRWLEDQESPEVAAWVATQAAHTDAWLARLPQRDQIRSELATIWDHPKVGVPWRRGKRWFQQRNTGLQEQSVLWTATAPDAEGSVLLDPATLSADGTVSLAGLALTPDGSRLAYGTSDGGSDWITWHVRDTATGADADDVVPWAKFAGAAWLHDGGAFYYGAFDAPAEGQELAATTRNHQLRVHRMGTDAAEDVTVYARPDQPDWGFDPAITEDGRWLVVTISQGTEPRSRIHLAPLTDADPAAVAIRPWLDDFDAEYDVIGNHGDTMFVRTDLDAPGGRVLAIDAHDAGRRREVLAQADHPLLAVRYLADGHPAGARLLVVRMVDAVHRVSIHDLEGNELAVVDLPDLSSIGEITGRQHDHQVHLALSSFAFSTSIHRLDVHTLDLTLVRQADVRLPEVVTEHVMVDSTEGARVPMFLIRHADAPADGGNRTILYGYGGFNISLSPEFRLWWTTWLQRGGIIAVGCYRGGGEYGRTWHDDGRLASKTHTFDDALACARWLTGQRSSDTGWSDTRWARPANIAITGGSNGGLTAAATMLRAPEAFGACVPEVGVLDLLRFHRFTIGWAWTSDFGDPDDAEDFPRIHAISPYHTVLATSGEYPATLITTADRDDRVVPAHSFKFTAAMQAAQRGGAPVLARIDTRAGHGAGTPTSKLIDARTDVIAFLEAVLPGRDPVPPVRRLSPLSALGGQP